MRTALGTGLVLALLAFLGVPLGEGFASGGEAAQAAPALSRQEIEADWLRQAELRTQLAPLLSLHR